MTFFGSQCIRSVVINIPILTVQSQNRRALGLSSGIQSGDYEQPGKLCGTISTAKKYQNIWRRIFQIKNQAADILNTRIAGPEARTICRAADASYLFRALQISITTSTDRAIVLGWGSSNTSQSTPLKRSSCTRHCMWCVYESPAIIARYNYTVYLIFLYY